jgi:hypothetical protein
MATVKKTNSNYIIQTPRNVVGNESNITLDTDTVFINGNLTVLGNTTTVSSNNLTITDNVIVLNQGQPGAGITKGNAGIMIDRGAQPYAQLQFNQAGGNVWQVTTDASLGFANILIEGAAFELVQDPAPVLDGNLNVNGQTIYANVIANSYVTIQGVMSIINANITPNINTGTTVFYANTAGAGTAGLYVVNEQATNEELVTKRRAFGFSLLL